MDKKNITIMTGTGGALGTGHFQRMCYLADSLNSSGDFSVRLLIAEGTPVIPDPLKELVTVSIPDSTDLVIRDMRDSTADDINLIKQIAPVLVIDDTGTGRAVADHVLDLFPSPVNRNFPEKMFLYGYNFISEIKSLKSEVIAKDIDIAIYAGYNPESSVIEEIRSAIPDDASVVLFAYGKASLLSEKQVPVESGYTDLLIRSRILITHFGITMYEGDLAGCRIIAVNPSSYHCELTGMVENKLNVIPAGEYGNINRKLINSEIRHIMKNRGLQIISKGSIRERININFDYFIKVFNNIISGGE